MTDQQGTVIGYRNSTTTTMMPSFSAFGNPLDSPYDVIVGFSGREYLPSQPRIKMVQPSPSASR